MKIVNLLEGVCRFALLLIECLLSLLLVFLNGLRIRRLVEDGVDDGIILVEIDVIGPLKLLVIEVVL